MNEQRLRLVQVGTMNDAVLLGVDASAHFIREARML
jgi:hypothetical protein